MEISLADQLAILLETDATVTSLRTRSEYSDLARKLETGMYTAQTIRSRSRWQQIRAVIGKLHYYGLIPKDETFGLDIPALNAHFRRGKKNGVQQIQNKVMTVEQVHAVIRACPNTPKGQELQFACRIAFYSGARASEILALQPADLTIQDEVIHVLIRKGKGGKSRVVWLPGFLTEDIQAFSGFSITLSYVTKTIHRIMHRLQIPSSFHGFRHTYATLSEVHPRDLQRLLGHADIQTTMIYQHSREHCPNALHAFWQRARRE